MKASDFQIFRYPGAKAKLAATPEFQDTMDIMIGECDTFYEAFLGSASVTLSLAVRYPKMQFRACELDSDISGFWQLIATGSDADFEMLMMLIRVPPTLEMFEVWKTPAVDLPSRAYRAVLYNRTTFSGIATAAPIGGLSQKSKWKIGCRYNVATLTRNVIRLRELFAGRLAVEQRDAVEWISSIPVGAPLYLDPPYYEKGRLLYPQFMTHGQHVALAHALSSRSNWLLSYDDSPVIESLYWRFATISRHPFRYSINGKKSNWVDQHELFIAA